MSNKNRNRFLIALAVLLLIGGAVGGTVWTVKKWRADLQFSEFKEKGEQASKEFMDNFLNKKFPSQERIEEMRQLRKEAEKLTPEQRAELEKNRIHFMAQEYDKFMTLSKEEQDAKLDQVIDAMEAARLLFGQRQPGQNPDANGPSGSGMGRPGRGPMNPEERDARRKVRLDRTTPEDRAKLEDGIRRLDDRRQQRGLPPIAPMMFRRF